MKNDFTGFVLAGGKSSRMGKDKFSLPMGGETFLERAVKSLSTACERVKIVLNRSQTISAKQPIVRDIFVDRGAPGGIHAALKNCETRFALILAVDLPLVTAEAVENLAAAAQEAAAEFSAVIPLQPGGKPQPLCAVYRAAPCLTALEKLLGENERASVRDFLELIAPRYVEASRLSADENLLFNVNFPADHQKIN